VLVLPPLSSLLASVLRLRFSMFADTARVTNARIIIIIRETVHYPDAEDWDDLQVSICCGPVGQ